MTKSMWGGRFETGPAEILRRLNDSFSFDRELFCEDIEASIAWARALGHARVISAAEAAMLVEGLRRIPDPEHGFGHAHDSDSERGVREPRQAGDRPEDVHSYIEARLYDEIGTVAGKLHTGRSRNDQVATALKLWLKNVGREMETLLTRLAAGLAKKALAECATPMPGYTHSKQAEPVTFGHWCLAYVEMLVRDLDRLGSMIERNDSCPLGSGALSGTPLPIDRELLARDLGFARPTANSLDSVSDRDFAVEYLFTAALALSHLSRMAEDLIFFSSDEAGYAELPDSLATGSSRMPQKKNPDVLELVRGHAGRAVGELTGLLALMKGLPLAYDKDLQLDKEPLFRTRTVLEVVLPALTDLISGLHLDRERMRAAASRDSLLATELADAIAARGVPFREAHAAVSARIGEAVRGKTTLRELGAGGAITADDLNALDVDRALSKRNAFGGTAPDRVRTAAQGAKALLDREASLTFDEATPDGGANEPR